MNGLAPEFVKAIETNNFDICKKVLEHVYTFPLFKPEFCASLLKEMKHFETWCAENHLAIIRPNSMNSYGAILDHCGMGPVIDEFVAKYVAPLSEKFYPTIGKLDSHHAFMVEYQMGKDRELGMHVDDSEVTINACLGTEFQGGELFFAGVRCGLHRNTPLVEGM